MFTLDNRSNKKKFTCPGCGQQRKFVRYIHTETFEELNENVGMCDRINSCGYHQAPKQFFANNQEIEKYFSNQVFKKVEPPKTSFIDLHYFNKSMHSDYSNNNFVNHLIGLYGQELTHKLCKAYCVGNSRHWEGANVFWQVDINLNIRHGQIILYDKFKFNRTKNINSVQNLLKKRNLIKEEFNLNQCFFGEHLLNYNSNSPVAIVESVKTAIICSCYIPDYLWLATGGANNGLKPDKFKSLYGREIYLFPDLNQFDNWQKKALEICKTLGMKIHVSDLLESHADRQDIEQGFDIADYLLKTDQTGRAIYEDGSRIENIKLLCPNI